MEQIAIIAQPLKRITAPFELSLKATQHQPEGGSPASHRCRIHRVLDRYSPLIPANRRGCESSGEYRKTYAGFVWSFRPEATVYRAGKQRQRYTRNAAVNALPLPNGWGAGSSHLPQGWWIVRPGNSRSWNMHARNASRRIPVWMNHLTRNTCRAYVMFLFAALAMFAGKMTGWWMDDGRTLSAFFFLQGISDRELSLENQRKRSFTFPLWHCRSYRSFRYVYHSFRW